MSFGPKFYSSIEEFHREEIQPSQKIGFSIDDLYEEATYNAEREIEDPSELNFDY